MDESTPADGAQTARQGWSTTTTRTLLQGSRVTSRASASSKWLAQVSSIFAYAVGYGLILLCLCTGDCVLALNDRGEVFGWGNSEYGQFNSVTEEQQLSRPTKLDVDKTVGKVIDIASGGSICMVLNGKATYKFCVYCLKNICL